MSQNQNPQCNTQAAVEAGLAAADAERRLLTIGDAPVALLPEGMKPWTLDNVVAFNDRRQPTPKRLQGTATFTEVEGFIAHVNRFKGPSSVVFADVAGVSLTAVYDYHEGKPAPASEGSLAAPAVANQPRWTEHRAVYVCPLSDQWKTWFESSDKVMDQAAFGQFLEDNLVDITNPAPQEGEEVSKLCTPAMLVTMARNLVLHSKEEFESKINPSTGEMSLLFKKGNDVKGNTHIPKSFFLAIPIFDEGSVFTLECRLRYKASGGEAKFSYSIVQPGLVLKTAFKDVRETVETKTGLPLWAGKPER